jgi:hypothetical protein
VKFFTSVVSMWKRIKKGGEVIVLKLLWHDKIVYKKVSGCAVKVHSFSCKIKKSN